jgi:hypothetical protein
MLMHGEIIITKLFIYKVFYQNYIIFVIGQIYSIIYKTNKFCGAMAELVDALVLGTNMATCEGSSPFRPTTYNYESYCRK